MANILTPTEAANVLRCSEDDPLMGELLQAIDTHLESITGWNWAAENPVDQDAKSAARVLLVRWHGDPGMIGQVELGLDRHFQALKVLLKTKVMEKKAGGLPDQPLGIDRILPKDGSTEIAVEISPVIVFNHKMTAGAAGRVCLKDSNGVTVTVTVTLDVTGKIMTISPSAPLENGRQYAIVIDAAPDIYGETLSDEIGFSTV